MSILDNEGLNPLGLGNAPSRAEVNDLRVENIMLRAALEQAERSRDAWIDVNAAAGQALTVANDAVGRLRAAPQEIADHRIDSEFASREKRAMAQAALDFQQSNDTAIPGCNGGYIRGNPCMVCGAKLDEPCRATFR